MYRGDTMTSIKSVVLKTGVTSVAIPDGAEIVDVGFDPAYGAPAIYFIKPGNLPEAPFVKRTFLVVTTYEIFENKFEVVYLGSDVNFESQMRLHFMEIING